MFDQALTAERAFDTLLGEHMYAAHRHSLQSPAKSIAVKLGLAVCLTVGMGMALAHVAFGHTTPGAETVTVAPGQTLWQIAEEHYPNDDPRERVFDIEQLNHLDSASITAGEKLQLP